MRDDQPLAGARIAGLAAHDRADRRADRDPGRPRGRGALGLLQHLLHPGRGRGRRGGRARTAAPTSPPVSRCSPGRVRRSRSTGGARRRSCSWPDGAGPNMILDDGGDATLLVHKGREWEQPVSSPRPQQDDPEEWKVILETVRGTLAEDPTLWTRVVRRHPRGDRGDHDRCAPALPAARGRQAALPGDQRQRLGHQVQVRQQVRRPAQPDRRAEPGDRRADRWQGRLVCGFGDVGKGCAEALARPGRPRRGHRDRPDLRAAGRDGGLPGRAPGGRPGQGRLLHHHHRVPATSSPPTTCAP